MQAAGKLDMKVGNPVPAPVLVELESAFSPKHDDWLGHHLPQMIRTTDGRVNRYVLDLMCRKKMAVVKPAEEALGTVVEATDAAAIIDALVLRGDAECLSALENAISYSAQTGHMASEVRKKGLEAAQKLVGNIRTDEARINGCWSESTPVLTTCRRPGTPLMISVACSDMEQASNR